MTEEEKFEKLYIQEYSYQVKLHFPKLTEVKNNYPDKLLSQKEYYKSILLNSASAIVEPVVDFYNIDLTLIFGEGYAKHYMIKQLSLKISSIKINIIKQLDDFYEDLLNQ